MVPVVLILLKILSMEKVSNTGILSILDTQEKKEKLMDLIKPKIQNKKLYMKMLIIILPDN